MVVKSINKRQKRLYDILYEEIEALHKDQVVLSKTNLDVTYRKIEIAREVIQLYKLLNKL